MFSSLAQIGHEDDSLFPTCIFLSVLFPNCLLIQNLDKGEMCYLSPATPPLILHVKAFRRGYLPLRIAVRIAASEVSSFA